MGGFIQDDLLCESVGPAGLFLYPGTLTGAAPYLLTERTLLL